MTQSTLADRLTQVAQEYESDRQQQIQELEARIESLEKENAHLRAEKALYDAGDEGLPMSGLSEALNRSRDQVAGVLGALGRRINGTPGLEGKGGILVVLDISEAKGGEWHYRMRPCLRQALELENVL
jgi:ribosomal protein L29